MEAAVSEKKTKTIKYSRTANLRKFLKNLFSRKSVVLGAIIIGLMVFCALFAPIISPHDPYEQNLKNILAQPTLEHPLGTDLFGRDVLSRIIYGTQASLIVGIVSVGIAAGVGMTLGLISGYFGKVVDSVLMRFMDAIMGIPPIVLALAIGAALGGGLANVMIALSIGMIPGYARLMRGEVLSVRQKDYVIAGEISGASSFKNMISHVLPNCLSPLIVLITLNMGVAILAEAALSFLGLGIEAPGAAWGSMINDGYQYMQTNPVLSFAPGVAVVVAVLAFSIVGDGLRDALDPKLRGVK